MEAEKINLQLKQHQVDVGDWAFGPLAKELHKWVEVFDLEFKLQLCHPVIAIDRLRKTTGGNFRRGRSVLGTRDSITINDLYLILSPAVTLGILLYELIHELQ